MGIDIAIDAELAYRHERLTQHYRPWHRVGSERRTAAHDSTQHEPARAAAASVINTSR